jgi:hypothetical protein
MLQHLDGALSAEIRKTVGHLPPYPLDPNSVDYTNAPIAYAVNVTILHGNMQRHPMGYRLPTPDTTALLVERAGGDGVKGSESGVAGYIGVLHDPEHKLTDEVFDPVGYAALEEPHSECGIRWKKMRTIGFHLGAVVRGSAIDMGLGQRFAEPRYRGNDNDEVRIAPILGISNSWRRPKIRIKEDEVSKATWVPLRDIAKRPNLSPGYLDTTLPSALGSLLCPEAVNDLLHPNRS